MSLSTRFFLESSHTKIQSSSANWDRQAATQAENQSRGTAVADYSTAPPQRRQEQLPRQEPAGSCGGFEQQHFNTYGAQAGITSFSTTASNTTASTSSNATGNNSRGILVNSNSNNSFACQQGDFGRPLTLPLSQPSWWRHQQNVSC